MEKNIFAKLIATAMNLQEKAVANTLALLDEGCTIPFISRYRKERTGGLDEVQIAGISDRYEKLNEIQKRKETVTKTITDLGKMTPELEKRIEAMVTSSVKGTFSKIPEGVFVLQANEMIEQWSSLIYQKIYRDLRDSLGIWPTRLDITDIRFNEGSEDYQQLKDLTSRQAYNISMQNQANVLSQLATDAAVRNGAVARQAEIQMELTRARINVDRLLLRQKDGFLSVLPTGTNQFGVQFERILPASAAFSMPARISSPHLRRR